MIGRKDVGEVAFLDPVDLRGVDLDAVVDMDKGRIQVCPGVLASQESVFRLCTSDISISTIKMRWDRP